MQKERKRELNLRVWSITNCLGYKTLQLLILLRHMVWSITNCLGYKTYDVSEPRFGALRIVLVQNCGWSVKFSHKGLEYYELSWVQNSHSEYNVRNIAEKFSKGA